MHVTRRTVLTVPAILWADSACNARDLPAAWSEWTTPVFEMKGPGEANGVFLYLHDEGRMEAPVPVVFAELAKIAHWDVLRINRRSDVDLFENDARLLAFVSQRVDHVRREGYGQVIVGGVGRGGWLALETAALPGVDGVVGTVSATAHRAERRRWSDGLQARDITARRIAAFLFAESRGDAAAEPDADDIRRVLQLTSSSFAIIDRPPDLYGPLAASSGRFARRYRDCLAEFLQSANVVPGEVRCIPSTGYAVGAEIGFPDSPLAALPRNADPALGLFWGRWVGDNENGFYMIMETVDVQVDGVILRFGLSSIPGNGSPYAGTVSDLAFQFDGGKRRLYHKFPGGHDMAALTFRTPSELDYVGQRSVRGRIHRYQVRLHKQVTGTR